MDIAGISMGLNHMKVKEQASLSVMKLAMDTAKTQSGDVKDLAASTRKATEQVAEPHLGRNIDISL